MTILEECSRGGNWNSEIFEYFPSVSRETAALSTEQTVLIEAPKSSASARI